MCQEHNVGVMIDRSDYSVCVCIKIVIKQLHTIELITNKRKVIISWARAKHFLTTSTVSGITDSLFVLDAVCLSVVSVPAA